MTESSENEIPIETVSINERRSRSGFWFGVIILLTLIGFAAVGFFLFYQLQKQQEDLGGEISKDDMKMVELTKQITGYQTQLGEIQKQLTNLTADIAGKEAFFNKRLSDFSELHDEKLDTAKNDISSSVKQIQRQLGKTRGDWLIADAEYLLTIANQRLHLSNDVNTTREALIAADQRLRESGDAAVFKVREQLAEEINALKKVTMPDIVGIYSKIQILQNNIGELTLFLPHSGKGISEPDEQPSEAQETEEQGESESDVQDILDSAFGELGDLITIRHTDRPIKSILTAEEVYFIQQQLEVKLEMVKLSLMQGNEKLYKAGLSDAREWLKEHFVMNKDAENFNNELGNLDSIILEVQLPDISKSLKMLRDITKLRIETDKAIETPAAVKVEQDAKTPAAVEVEQDTKSSAAVEVEKDAKAPPAADQ